MPGKRAREAIEAITNHHDGMDAAVALVEELASTEALSADRASKMIVKAREVAQLMRGRAPPA
jgi:hypothetical protein